MTAASSFGRARCAGIVRRSRSPAGGDFSGGHCRDIHASIPRPARARTASAAIRRAGIAAPGLAAVVAGLPLAARAGPVDGPMSLLETFGAPGSQVAPILKALLWLGLGVAIVIAVLVVAGVALRARRVGDMRVDARDVARSDDRSALRWMVAGLVATTGLLAFFTVWTVGTMAAVHAPPAEPAVTIEVTGHQWWWEVKYLSDDPARVFETANEIHVPVGEPVRLLLRSTDVIHSFWVPAVAGKTDMIPGQENVAWLRADAPGVYRGQCVEYCGRQHAKMGLRLFADPPDEFAAWWDGQLSAAGAGVPPGDRS